MLGLPPRERLAAAVKLALRKRFGDLTTDRFTILVHFGMARVSCVVEGEDDTLGVRVYAPLFPTTGPDLEAWVIEAHLLAHPRPGFVDLTRVPGYASYVEWIPALALTPRVLHAAVVRALQLVGLWDYAQPEEGASLDRQTLLAAAWTQCN